MISAKCTPLLAFWFYLSLCDLVFGTVIRRHCKKGLSDIQLLSIDLSMMACNASLPFADECRTAYEAAPFVTKAFVDYNITSRGEKAAILSLMLFESDYFRYNKNHYPAPGRPGQGTRSMMAYPSIHQYALDTPTTRGRALALVGQNATDDSISNETMNAVRELVLVDELSFASAMWFYKASGPDRVGCAVNKTLVSGLVAETRKGWESYIGDCVHTTVTEERAAVWNKTLDMLRRTTMNVRSKAE